MVDAEGAAVSFPKGCDPLSDVSQFLPAGSRTVEGAWSPGRPVPTCAPADEPIANYLMRWEIPMGPLHVSRNVIRHFP